MGANYPALWSIMHCQSPRRPCVPKGWKKYNNSWTHTIGLPWFSCTLFFFFNETFLCYFKSFIGFRDFFSVKWELYFLRTSKSALKSPVLSGNRLKQNYNITSHDVELFRCARVPQSLSIWLLFFHLLFVYKNPTDNSTELLRKLKHRENKLSEIET